jgi:hypothetical protein
MVLPVFCKHPILPIEQRYLVAPEKAVYSTSFSNQRFEHAPRHSEKANGNRKIR